jgi:glutaryl-CoA dehydrogenase
VTSSRPRSGGYLDKTRAFVDEEVLPVINEYWERAEFPRPLVAKLAMLAIVGDGIEGYGCPRMSPIASGLIHMALHRGDGSLGTFLGVQAGLAMQSIAMLGSEEQKSQWLPEMAALTTIGAFALTEPEHGSDSVALQTTARRDGAQLVGDMRVEADRACFAVLRILLNQVASAVGLQLRDELDHRAGHGQCPVAGVEIGGA